jgi:ribosomal 50S subunit-recycling heat shock protein
VGDTVEILYTAGSLKFRVLDIKETVKKEQAQSLYEVIV